jgi:hypothetical protein
MSSTTQATGTVVLQATLKDNAGNPLSGQTIQLQYQVQGATTWTNGVTGTTDSNGNASLSQTLPAPGVYNFQAQFAGVSNQYAPATSNELTAIAVIAGTTLTISVVSVTMSTQ